MHVRAQRPVPSQLSANCPQLSDTYWCHRSWRWETGGAVSQRFPKAWATSHFTSKIHDKSKRPHLGNLQFLAGKPTKIQKPSHAGYQSEGLTPQIYYGRPSIFLRSSATHFLLSRLPSNHSTTFNIEVIQTIVFAPEHMNLTGSRRWTNISKMRMCVR